VQQETGLTIDDKHNVAPLPIHKLTEPKVTISKLP